MSNPSKRQSKLYLVHAQENAAITIWIKRKEKPKTLKSEINSRTEKNAEEKEERTRAFEHESDSVAAVVGLDGDDVVITSTLKHLGHVVEVHAHGDVAVAAVVLEALGSEEESDEGDVAGVHGLEGEPGGGAVKVCINIKDLITLVFK